MSVGYRPGAWVRYAQNVSRRAPSRKTCQTSDAASVPSADAACRHQLQGRVWAAPCGKVVCHRRRDHPGPEGGVELPNQEVGQVIRALPRDLDEVALPARAGPAAARERLDG